MSINQWRYKEGTDDGCSVYQCLMCYGTWEGRTSPGWFDVDNTYHAVWKFCPCCGTIWDGCRTTDPEVYAEWRNLGPRRLKIEKAKDKRYRDYGWPSSPEPPYWIVIEEAQRGGFFLLDGELKWEPKSKMSGWKCSAKKMLEFAREDVAKKIIEERVYHSDEDGQLHKEYKEREFLARVIVVRNIKAHYKVTGYSDHIYEIRLQCEPTSTPNT